MNVLVTGGSGFIGRAVVRLLLADGHNVVSVSRSAQGHQGSQLTMVHCDLVKDELPLGLLSGIDAIIHLAGAPVPGLWTPGRKRAIRDSRIGGAQKLVAAINALPPGERPKAVIGASAIGYYGDGGERLLLEEDDAGDDFLARVCVDWEGIWNGLPDSVRRVSLRTGIVLEPSGGILKPLLLAARLHLGIRPGSGKQFVSWISLADMAAAYRHALITQSLNGSINAVAPNPVRFSDLVAALLSNHRPAVVVPIPAPLLRVGMGEASHLLLYSQRVSAERLQKSGFVFEVADLKKSLTSS